MTARRAFLHIGSPKAGTTFLQHVLWSQRGRAAELGLLLPLGSVHDHFHASLDLRGIRQAPNGTDCTGAWQRLLDACRDTDGDVLVSHELFCLADDAQAHRATADLAALGFEVHVVLTARDLARQLPSLWQEAVKARGGLTFAEYVAQLDDPATSPGWSFARVQDYAGLLRRWGADLPAAHRHLVTVPRPGAPRDLLWRRFAGVLGLRADAFALEGRSNESLGVEQVELLRRVNRALDGRLAGPGEYLKTVKGTLVGRVLTTRPGAPLTLAGPDLALARERSAPVLADLAALDLDVVGDLEELRVPDGAADQADGASSGRATVPDDVLLTEALEATIALLELHAERNRRHRARLAKLRQRARRLEAARSRPSAARRLAGRLARRRTTR